MGLEACVIVSNGRRGSLARKCLTAGLEASIVIFSERRGSIRGCVLGSSKEFNPQAWKPALLFLAEDKAPQLESV